ncbi:MAG: rhomboid family intramembrane serine protease [Bacteroidota bacterium]
MLKEYKTISLTNLDTATTLAIAYEAMKTLGWPVRYAGPEMIIGSTPVNWKTKGQSIVVSSDGTEITVSSEMVNGEMVDITGKNKQNTEEFIRVFESAKNNISESVLQNNKTVLEDLKAATLIAAEEEEKSAIEIDKAMHLSTGNLYVTYTIIGINMLVFILMALNGAGIFEPNSLVHAKWGSNYSSLTLSGDWWRLFTNVFIHFGIIHLLMNMYCLYTIGVYLEPMLGKIKYTTAYICTGIIASVVSLWWHKEGINSAGASGAIFGLYGVFLALLTTSLIPKAVRNSLLQSIGIFVVFNLVYGMKSGVDNSAHVGGLVSGLVVGYVYAFGIKKENNEQKVSWILPLIILATLVIGYEFLEKNKISSQQRIKELAIVDAASFKDNEKFNDIMFDFDRRQAMAMAPIEDSSARMDDALKMQIDNVSYPQWQQMEIELIKTKQFEVAQLLHKRADKLLEYVALRKKELDEMKKIIDTDNATGWTPALDEIRKEINKVVAEIP